MRGAACVCSHRHPAGLAIISTAPSQRRRQSNQCTRKELTPPANRVQGYTGCNRPSEGPTPQPTAAAAQHASFPTHAWVCCGPLLNAAQSPHPADHGLQLHSQPIMRASYTPHHIQHYATCHIEAVTAMASAATTGARAQLAATLNQSNRRISAQTKEAPSYVPANAAGARRSARHMHSRHTEFTSAAHPQVGLPCPPAASLAYMNQARTHGSKHQQTKGCCSASHAPELPSPHQHTNTNTPTRGACLANKTKQQYAANTRPTLPDTQPALGSHPDTTNRRADRHLPAAPPVMHHTHDQRVTCKHTLLKAGPETCTSARNPNNTRHHRQDTLVNALHTGCQHHPSNPTESS